MKTCTKSLMHGLRKANSGRSRQARDVYAKFLKRHRKTSGSQTVRSHFKGKA